MSELAKAYVQIIPSSQGMAGAISGMMGSEAQSAGESAGSTFSNAMAGAIKVAGAAITAAVSAVTAAGMASVQAGMKFDASMSQVAATMGTTVDQIEDLRNFAQEMGASTAFSASEAAEALNYMALAGYDAETSMQMLPTVLNLAAAGGIGLAEASDMVTDAQSALGLSIEETAAMVDEMAMTASKSNTSVAGLGDAFLTIGATARNVQGGTEELSTILGVLADNGIKASEGGTHLRNILLSLQGAADKAGNIDFGDFAVSIYDANGDMRSMVDIIGELQEGMGDLSQQEKDLMLGAMFNKTDLAAVNALLGTSQERYSELFGEIRGAWYVQSSFAEALEASGSSFEEMESNLQGLGIDAEKMEAALKESGGSATDFANVLWEWADAGVSYDDVVNAIGGDMKSLQEAMNATAGSAQQMADTQLDNLDGDITIFKSALEGAEIAISDQLTPSLREFVQFGSSAVSELTEAFKEGGLTGAMEALGGVLSEGLGKIISNLPDLVNAGMQLLRALGQGLLDNLDVILDAAVEIVKQIGAGIVEALPEIADGAVQIITELAGTLTEMLPELIPAAVQMVIELVNSLLQNVPLLVSAAMQLVTALAQGLIAALPVLIRALPELLRNLLDALMGSIGMIIEAVVSLVEMIAESLPEIITAIVEVLPELIDMLVEAVLELLPVLIDGSIQLTVAIAEHLPEIMSALIDALPQIIDAIIVGLSGLTVGVLGIFGDLFGKIGTAISDWWNGLKADIKTGFDSFINSYKEWLENLPYNLGVALGNMILKFIEWKDNAIAWVETELPEIISNILTFFDELPGNIREFFIQIITDLKTWADDMIDNIKTEVPKIIDDITGFFEELPGKARQWGKDLIDSFIAGIRQMWDDAMGVFEDFAQGVQDIIGFSEPKKGPLSNFHTYAPDMMELFAKGITDNKDLVQGTVEDAFNLREAVTGGAGEEIPDSNMLIRPTGGRNMTVILELDRMQLGKAVYQLNNDEMQRVGVNLAGGYNR